MMEDQSTTPKLYLIERTLGSGGFGNVYLGRNVRTGQIIAIKMAKDIHALKMIQHEYNVYEALGAGDGIPRIHFFGQNDSSKILAMDLLGLSLEHLFKRCNCKLSLKTVLMLADQMIERVEYLHKKNYIHRDIKPSNFVMGRDRQQSKLFLIDFGLSKEYRSPVTMAHIRFRTGKSLIGTARFASIGTHYGVEQSRRDDMVSLGYALIYLMRGSLPWQNVSAGNKLEKFNRILKKKLSISDDELCKGLPVEFLHYLTFVQSLQFVETPNYTFLRNLFRELFRRLDFKQDYEYEWTYMH